MLEWPLAEFFGFFCYFCIGQFKWAACKKCRIKQPRQGEGGTDDAPSLCIHTRMTRLTTRTTVPKIGNVAEEVVGMDGMVVQGGAREWRGKAAR